MRRLASALPLAAAVLVSASGARAQRLDLRYEAPRECPSQAALQRQVTEARGASTRPDRALAAAVTITAPSPRWRAVITTRSDGGEGTRTLEARSCGRLVQAVALVIALAIDTEAERPEESAPAPPPPPPPVLFVEDGELPPALRPRRRAPTAPVAPSVTFGVSARVILDARSLPEVTAGFGVGLSLGGRRVLARVEGTLLAERAAAGTRMGSRTIVRAWTATALGCARPHEALELCAGVELTGMDARAEGFRQNGVDRSLYLATPLRATFRLPLTRHFTLGFAPEVVVPWTRTEYRVAGVGVVHAVPAVVFRQGLTFEATWP